MTSSAPSPASSRSVSPPSSVSAVRKQPPKLEGVTLLGGAFEVGLGALDVLCQDIFGEGSGYVPAREKVFFDLGWVGMTEGVSLPWSFLCLRMLVRAPGGDEQAVVTHAFVDRVSAVTLGREVFGVPAIPATFEFQLEELSTIEEPDAPGTSDPHGPDIAALVALGGSVLVKIDALRDEDKHPSQQPIVEVAVDASAPGGEPLWNWNQTGASETSQPFTQVLQIRDAVDPERACLQDLIPGEVSGRVTDGGTLGGSRPSITLFDYRSFLLAGSFGVLPRLALSTNGYRATRVALTFELPRAEAEEPARSGRNGGPFRARTGDPQFAPTYEFHDVELIGFRVPASLACLRALVDEQLNDPFPERAYRYEPASHSIIIECLDYGSMLAAHAPPGFRSGDSTSQRELIFRVLVGRVNDGSGIAREPALFCPFLYVDSSWSLLSGREVIGYPKAIARFRAYRVNAELEGCCIDAPDRGGGAILTLDCRPQRDGRTIEELLEDGATTEAPVVPRVRRLREPSQQLWWGLDHLQGALDLDDFIRPWMRGAAIGYGAVQPKYFVNARAPEQLRYAELLHGDYTIHNMDVELPNHRATLTFDDADSFGLRKALGVGEHLVVPPESWYRARCDFRVRIFDPLA